MLSFSEKHTKNVIEMLADFGSTKIKKNESIWISAVNEVVITTI